ncbi:MAG: hypothetical protein U1F83_18900 [Verrucomicrobiota bacterium]
MLITSKDIPDLYRLIHDPQLGGIDKIKNRDVSLSVVLFLAVTHRTLWLKGNSAASASIARLGLPGLSRAINCLMEATPTPCQQPFGAPTLDLYRITAKKDLQRTEWQSFCDRFRRSADAGRTGEMYYTVASAFGEMGDNVVSHAFEADHKPCPAIAGFHVTNGTACFCVVDVGQGFLKSLHRKQEWSGLRNDYEALDAVVTKRATSRPGEKEGGGFKDLFKSLIEFNGKVVLRSGTSTFYMNNKGTNGDRHAVQRAFVPGSAVTAVISKTGQPEELSLQEAENC